MLAQTLAKSWMCTNPAGDGSCCGECNVCKAMDAGRAVDVLVWRPWGPSSQIKLSSLRPTPQWDKDTERPDLPFVLDFFRTRPLMARNKVVVFEQADKMNSDTANAFLKTLEEPGDNAKVILTTSEFARVLPTIRSRCMCVACELPARSSATAAGGDPVESVFGASPGGVAHVRDHRAVYDRLFETLEATRQAPFGAAFKFAEECRDIANEYGKSTGSRSRAADVKIVEAIAAWVAWAHPDRPDLLRSAAEAHRRMGGNGQAAIVLEDLFLDLLYHG